MSKKELEDLLHFHISFQIVEHPHFNRHLAYKPQSLISAVLSDVPADYDELVDYHQNNSSEV